MSRDVELHRELYSAEENQIQPVYEQVRLVHVLEELQFNFSKADIAKGKTLDFRDVDRDMSVLADRSLFRRILMNMLTNAFEATVPGGSVRCWVEHEEGFRVCCVWSRAVIPENIRLRIFQRHFSTKSGVGRGLGTYAMKQFAENVMGGKMSFTSSVEEGTVFRLALPEER